MNKKCLAIILALPVLVTGISSCKKDTVAAPAHEVVYQVEAGNYDLFTQVIYTGAENSLISIPAITPSVASIKVTPTANPFHAKILATVHNTSAGTLNYTLKIYVDGVLKAEQPGIAET